MPAHILGRHQLPGDKSGSGIDDDDDGEDDIAHNIQARDVIKCVCVQSVCLCRVH